MSWIDGNAWVVWLALALLLGAVEAATVDFVFLMLAGGALAGSVSAGFGASFPVQTIVAVVVAIALLGVVRPSIKRRFMPDLAQGIGAAANVGRTAVVLATVTERDGRVKLGGEVWSARTAPDRPEIEAGQEVHVVAIDGATVVVAPAEGAGEITT